MQRWILLSVVVAALYVCLGDGLQCFHCEALCTDLNRQKVTCAPGQQCGVRKEYKGIISSSKEMCVDKALCGTKKEEVSVTGMKVHFKYICCDGDRCNVRL